MVPHEVVIGERSGGIRFTLSPVDKSTAKLDLCTLSLGHDPLSCSLFSWPFNMTQHQQVTEKHQALYSAPLAACLTWPLNGMDARWRSNADWRSVVTMTTLSPKSYVSRTLPCEDHDAPSSKQVSCATQLPVQCAHCKQGRASWCADMCWGILWVCADGPSPKHTACMITNLARWHSA